MSISYSVSPTMNEQTSLQLWAAKFCIKVVYPKFNSYAFLVFLAIKYRIYHNRILKKIKTMDIVDVKTAPSYFIKKLLKEHLDNYLPVVLDKCIVIPRDMFVKLTYENLFYFDNGVLWLVLKLSPDIRESNSKLSEEVKKEQSISKFNFYFMTSEIHKKLWDDNTTKTNESSKIVPVIGSEHVDTAVVCENEYYNLSSMYELNSSNLSICFHSIPSIELAPKIAAAAEVSLIVNDFDLANDFLKEILSNYFEVPKVMSRNDIFSIELKPEITAKHHYKYLDLVHSIGKLYFKCRKITSDIENSNDDIVLSYFIVKGLTQLSLGENIHILKPRDEYFKFDDCNMRQSFLSLCPTGLKQKFIEIQEAITPFVTEDINDLSSSLSNPLIPMILLTGPIGSGRHQLVRILAKYNGINCLQIDCNALQSSTAKQTESKINAMIQKAKAAAPATVLLDHFEVFAVDPENNEDCRITEYFMNTLTDLYQNYTKHTIVFIAVTERQDLKPNILRMFLEHIRIPKLNLQQRYEMLNWFSNAMGLNFDKETSSTQVYEEILKRVAAKTETFLYGDIDTLIHFAIRESYLKQHCDTLPSDPNLRLVNEDNFNSALESIRKLQSQHLDAPKIPKVYWEDIGGLEKLKKELLKTIEFPIKYPHLFKNSSLKRSGILLYGPPGCGKTLVAKAVSTELNVSFLSVKGPELLNMYIGQSEENVRKVFESARASSPCIVFLDELDALAPRRGAAGDSGGASDRVVSQLLAEVDGVSSGEEGDTGSFVFIMGATNRPDLLEQSLLRPGRLDKLIYVGPYNGIEEKTCVLKALCRSYKLRPEVNLSDVAAALPEQCTGADLLQVVSTARAAAVRGLVSNLHSGIVKESELSPDSIILGISELWQGVKSFRPSVTDEELVYYESLQSQI